MSISIIQAATQFSGQPETTVFALEITTGPEVCL